MHRIWNYKISALKSLGLKIRKQKYLYVKTNLTKKKMERINVKLLVVVQFFTEKSLALHFSFHTDKKAL